MSQRSMVVALALVACGGGAKQADSPGNCPEGTILKGSDCVPAGDDSSSSGSPTTNSSESGTSGPGTGGPADDTATGGKTPYDKDSVGVELKRAARQVKANCGSATDDDGKAAGPWGSTKVSVVLGRNGHIKQVSVPPPFDGKPVGLCIVHAFQKIQFPPYAGSSDVTIEWDVEIVQPKP